MTMWAEPLPTSGDDEIPDELIALTRLEKVPNGIRLRIAGLAPDQLYRGTIEQLSIAEEISLAVDRERAYLAAFQQAMADNTPRLEEPQPGPGLLDRDFAEDLGQFFDLRRETLNLVRSIPEDGFAEPIALPGGRQTTLRDLVIRLARIDTKMLRTISEQRRGFLQTNGVDELRDSGLAGKLGPNIGQ